MEVICPFCKQIIKINNHYTTYSCNYCVADKSVQDKSYLFMFSISLKDKSITSIAIMLPNGYDLCFDYMFTSVYQMSIHDRHHVLYSGEGFEYRPCIDYLYSKAKTYCTFA